MRFATSTCLILYLYGQKSTFFGGYSCQERALLINNCRLLLVFTRAVGAVDSGATGSNLSAVAARIFITKRGNEPQSAPNP